MKVNSHVDAALIQLLGVICIRRDIAYEPEKLAEAPFNHIIGVLARDTLAKAIKKDGIPTMKFQLRSELCERFQGQKMANDHVFPIHQWKLPLLKAAQDEAWTVNDLGLLRLREFVQKHYVTARIPVALHNILSQRSMPKGWTYVDTSSMWARYMSAEVTKLFGRELALPKNQGDLDSDFELLK